MNFCLRIVDARLGTDLIYGPLTHIRRTSFRRDKPFGFEWINLRIPSISLPFTHKLNTDCTRQVRFMNGVSTLLISLSCCLIDPLARLRSPGPPASSLRTVRCHPVGYRGSAVFVVGFYALGASRRCGSRLGAGPHESSERSRTTVRHQPAQ